MPTLDIGAFAVRISERYYITKLGYEQAKVEISPCTSHEVRADIDGLLIPSYFDDAQLAQ
jgi:hypothetical protein